VGQYLNVNVPSDRGPVHGVGVALLVATIPAFLFGLWGMRARHGGLGRLGKIAIVCALASPFVAFPAVYAVQLFGGMALLGIAVVVLVVEMLRANVLPVVPLVLVAAGPVAVLVLALGVTAAGGDAGAIWAYPMLLTGLGYLWLGWYLWREPAVDTHRHGPLAAA
jgi:hypothetical protein